MASTVRLTMRILNTLNSGTLSQRAFQARHNLLKIHQKRPSSAASIALRASIKHPAHKLVKKPWFSIGKTLSEPGAPQVWTVLQAINHRKQLKVITRERVWTGTKYVWKFVEALYCSFTLFVMYMAGMDWITGGEVLRKGKK